MFLFAKSARCIALVASLMPLEAIAQTADAASEAPASFAFGSQVTSSPTEPLPLKGWTVDVAGTFALGTGLGAASLGLGPSAAVALIRTTALDEFNGHRCFGVTAMVTSLWVPSPATFAGSAVDQWFLVGPQWDSGDSEGTLYLRILGGARRVAGTIVTPTERFDSSSRSVAIGAGFGLAVDRALLDVNWLVSPSESTSLHRLTISLGVLFSKRLSPRR